MLKYSCSNIEMLRLFVIWRVVIICQAYQYVFPLVPSGIEINGTECYSVLIDILDTRRSLYFKYFWYYRLSVNWFRHATKHRG